MSVTLWNAIFYGRDVLYQPRSTRRIRIRLPTPGGKHRVYYSIDVLYTWRAKLLRSMSERRKLQARLRKRRQKSSVPADVRREEATCHQQAGMQSPGMQSVFTSIGQSLEACW